MQEKYPESTVWIVREPRHYLSGFVMCESRWRYTGMFEAEDDLWDRSRFIYAIIKNKVIEIEVKND